MRRPEAAADRQRPVIRLFGPLAIEVEGRRLGPRDLGGTRPKRVLEILLAARGHAVPTDRLAELLWGRELPKNASGSLQTFVSVLRRFLVPDRAWARELVVTEAEAYRLDTALVDLDLDRFDALVERARREAPQRGRRLLEDALQLVRGDVLEDEPYAVWAHDLRATYRGRVLGAFLEAADAALAELDYSGALAHTDAAVRIDPFNERAQRASMLGLYALGRQHEALDTYRRFRALLDEELGLAPTAEIRALEAAILRQEDVVSLVPRPPQPTPPTSSSRSVRLLGRTGELGTLERATRRALAGSFELILVEGEAGIGKTRLLDELVISLVGARVGRACASKLERHLPYVPLAAALREALGRVELERRRRTVLAAIVPELSPTQGQRPTDQLAALEALVGVIAEYAPLVLVIDDLHWADSSTIAAISYLQRRCSKVGLALVATARTEEMPPDHPVRSLGPDIVVRLEPLTRAELAPLGIPEIFETTGGIPRFLAETTGKGRDSGLSSTLVESLRTQYRAEGPRAYRVLLTASVVGRSFEPEPLAALLDADTLELTEELERLCERHLLSVDGIGFRFRCELVRDVLLSSVSPARRRQLDARLRHAGAEAALARRSDRVAMHAVPAAARAR